MRRAVGILAVIILAFAYLAASRQAPRVVLAIDVGHSVDYARVTCEGASEYLREDRELIARTGCEAVTACPVLRATVSACDAAAGPGTAQFFDRLTAQLASKPECSGVLVTKFDEPNLVPSVEAKSTLAQGHSTLFVDYVPGIEKQSWSLQRDASFHFIDGEGEPEQIASRVCALLPAAGAKLLR